MRYFLPIFLLIAVALVFSYPAMRAPQRLAVGSPDSDACDSLWLSWAFSRAIGEADLSLADFTMLIDPAGVDLWPHLGNFIYPLVLTPAIRRGGPVAAANIGLFVIFFCNVLFAFLFLRYVVGDGAAAMPPALAFGVGTYPLSEAAYGNPELAGVFVLPLAAWAVVRAADRPAPYRSALAFLALVFAALWNAYYGLAAFLFAGLAAVWAGAEERSLKPPAAVGGAIVAAGLALLPVALMLARTVAADAPAAGWQVGAGSHLDFLELVFTGRTYPNTVPYFIFVGALAALLTRRRRAALFWWATAAMLFLFSLGETLHFWGHDSGIPGPYRLLDWLPGMERARWPYRFAVMAHLALAAPAGLALRSLWETLESGHPRNERQVRTIVTLAALLASFLALPNPAMEAQAPEAYATLDGQEAGGVLALPANDNFYTNSHYLFYQVFHQRPLLVARPLPDRPPGFPPAALTAAPGLAPLNDEPPDLLALAEVDQAALRNDLRVLGIRFVALHPGDVSGQVREPLKIWCRETFGDPWQVSDTVLLYRLD